MASYTYVDDVNSNLICCVCQAPFLNPIVTTTCSHTFCKDCIVRSLESQPCCPVDRSPLSPDDLKPENMLLRNMVDELVVECFHRPSGCRHTCQRQLLSVHMRDSCQYVQVACSEDGCDEKVLRRDLGKHTHDCVHRVVECTACGVSIRAFDLESHNSECAEQDASCPACARTLRRADLKEHNQQCPEVEVACKQFINGCPWTGARKALASHSPKCPYEAIKGFFTLNEARMSTLHDENAMLRQKLENAEMTISSLRRGLEIARRALGPWWKSGDTHFRAQSEEFTDSLTTAQQAQLTPEQSRWRTPNPASPILTFSSDSSSISITNGTDSSNASPAPSFSDPAFLASYFPASSDVGQHELASSPHPASPAQVDPITSQPFSFSALGAYPPPPIRFPDMLHAPADARGVLHTQMHAHARVAPVDRDATLEGALCGLRASAVSLSNALDTLARRTDVALTTENLHMNEEVGALRAIVHGLRMQVHALIMERTATSFYNHPPPALHPPLVINSTTQTTKL